VKGVTIICFLPPNCIFCAHYNNDQNQTESSRDCHAFMEIPKGIFLAAMNIRSRILGMAVYYLA